MTVTQVLIVAASGAAGAVTRWGTSVAAQNLLGKALMSVREALRSLEPQHP